MQLFLKVLLVFWMSCFSLTAFSQESVETEVVDLVFTGLKKTEVNYLKRFMKTRKLSVYDSLQIHRDEQELRNLLFFSHVNCEIRDTVGGKKVVFDFKEKWTLFPIFNFNLAESNPQFSLGMIEYNGLGRGLIMRAAYHYYDRHSFETSFFNPYIRGSRFGAGLDLARYATQEPTYFPEGITYYDFTLWKAGINTQYELQLRHHIGFGAMYLREMYQKNEALNGEGAMGPDNKSFNKYLFQINHRINKIDYKGQFLSGWSNQLYTDWVLTQGETTIFYKILNEFRFFKQIKRKATWGAKLRMGIAENKFSPFPAFVHDNYTNLRGIGNRTRRGTAELTVNTEYRHTLANLKWVAVEGVAFVDYSTLRLPEKRIVDMFNNVQTQEVFGGLGIRIHLLNFFESTLRIDYSCDLKNQKLGGFVIGLGQYF